MARHSKIWLHDAVPGNSLYLTLVTEARLQDQMRREYYCPGAPRRSYVTRAFHGEPSHCAGHDAYASRGNFMTVGEPTSRTLGFEDDLDLELLLVRRQLEELRR